MYYKKEDEKKMIKNIRRDIKSGMKAYSYYPVKDGWIYHSGLFCIHSLGGNWIPKKDDKKGVKIK